MTITFWWWCRRHWRGVKAIPFYCWTRKLGNHSTEMRWISKLTESKPAIPTLRRWKLYSYSNPNRYYIYIYIHQAQDWSTRSTEERIFTHCQMESERKGFGSTIWTPFFIKLTILFLSISLRLYIYIYRFGGLLIEP